MTTRINRRALAAGLLAATAATAVTIGKSDSAAALRGDHTARLPDHAALWSRMPLPFTPAEAWHLLSPATQAEIGAAVIGMHLAQYVHGDSVAEADCFLDGDLRDDASDVEHDILNRMDDRLWTLFPDLYGPDGDHPAWALTAGMVHPLGAGLPEPPAAPALTASTDPIFAAINAADSPPSRSIRALWSPNETHVRIPDFSTLPVALVVSTRTLPADPMLAAIDAHAEAWAVFQIADAGRPSEIAEDAMSVALEDLLATPCGSHFGALALIRHLRWLIRDEAITVEADSVLDRFILAREADLSRFAGSDLPLDLLPIASPLGRFAPPVVPSLPPVLAAPQGDPILRRVLRAPGLAGEIFAAVAIIIGGAVLTGLATLL